MKQIDEAAKTKEIATESELAKRLLQASDGERRSLYAEVYDRTWSTSLETAGPTPLAQTRGANPRLLATLRQLTRPSDRILEMGCGTGYLSLELARMNRAVTGLDVSVVATKAASWHARDFGAGAPSFMAGSAIELPFAGAAFDFIFSIEMVEHLHERDVPAHLAEAHRVLKPGGTYWILTPNRHMEFNVHARWGIRSPQHSDTADVHLKEWSYSELSMALRKAGFEDLRSPWRHQRFQFVPLLPVGYKCTAEWVLRLFGPQGFRILANVPGIVGCSILGNKRPDE